MHAQRMGPGVFVSVTLFFFQLVSPSNVSGQAWVPRKGFGNVSITYRNFYFPDHSTATGKKQDRGQIRIHALAMDLDYGLTRKLAVNVGVPFMSGKYTGAYPHIHPGHRFMDDEKYHGTFQDFRLGLRYNLVRSGPLVITPFVDGIVPSHSYEIMAHSAVGRNLRELLVGTNVGWQLEPVLPNAYVQARISYGFVERVLGRSHNRTNLDVDFGYFLTPRVALSGLATFAKHHGGLVAGQQYTDDEFEVHNQLFRYDTLDVGGGAAFLVNRSTSVFATLLTTVWSRNAHVLRPGFIVGINWRFRTRRPRPLTSANISQPDSPDLVREFR